MTRNPNLDPIKDLWLRRSNLPVNNFIVETSKPLALARKRAIGKVTRKWFAFIDDDIFLDLWWPEKVFPYATGDVAAIQGTATPIGLGRKFDKALREYFSTVRVRELKKGDRMFTHNTLIRTETVRDWNPPADLEAYEDWHMAQHIFDKGGRILVVGTDTFHRYTWQRAWNTARWGTRGRLRFYPNDDIFMQLVWSPYFFKRDGFYIGFLKFWKKLAGMCELILGGS